MPPLENLQKFISDNAQEIYLLNPLPKEVVLTKDHFVVPDSYKGVVPFSSGKSIAYTVHTVI